MAGALDSTRSLRLPAAAALATFLCTLGLDRLIQAGPWLAEISALAVLIAALGAGARRINTPRPLIVPAQVVLVLIGLVVMLVPHAATAGFLPGPQAVRALVHLVNQGGLDLRNYAPPAPATPGVTALLTVSGAGFALLVDLLAVTLRRPVLTGLPMLAVYLIPATRLPGGTSWLGFVACALGYLVLLGTDGQDRLSQWGRTVHRRSGRPLQGSTNTGLTRQIATWAIGAALVIPMLIPTLPRVITLSGAGSGGGGQGSTIFLDQTVDISRDLTSSTPVPLLDYRTDAPPSEVPEDYLQMYVLTQFSDDGNSWTPPAKAETALPGTEYVPGLARSSNVHVETVHTSVTVIGNLGFSAVPAPAAVTDLSDVSGLQNIVVDTDTATMFVNDNVNASRQNAHYTAVSRVPMPTSSQLETATVGHDPIGRNYLALPSGFPSVIAQDARQITASATTPYDKAMALQQYFLGNGFRYSLSVKAEDGVPAIVSFLKNKVGFCEQYAATMAAMARSLGIPAVVAEGFTPGEVQSDGSYEVTTHDAHAWPLLYFDNFGWVRFEPTPSIVTGGRAITPPWAQAPAKSSGNGTNPGTTVSTSRATPTPTASRCPGGGEPVSLPRHVGDDSGSGETGCGAKKPSLPVAAAAPFSSWGPLGALPRAFQRWFLTGNPAQIGVKLLLLALVLLTGVPGTARLLRRRRRRRLMRSAATAGAALPRPRSGPDDGPEPGAGGFDSRFGPSGARRQAAFTAWEELREYATDLGYGWPESDTPRQLAGRLSAQAEFDEASQAAVGRVTTLVERAVYSPDPDIAPEEARALPEDVSRLRGALGSAAGRGARLRAALLPSSSLDYVLRRGRRS
jgi:transglutaminase-like putative cysteine protease